MFNGIFYQVSWVQGLIQGRQEENRAKKLIEGIIRECIKENSKSFEFWFEFWGGLKFCEKYFECKTSIHGTINLSYLGGSKNMQRWFKKNEVAWKFKIR